MMNKTEFVITIVEFKQKARLEGFFKVFKPMASIQQIYYSQDVKKYVCLVEDEKGISSPAITFIHAGDYEYIKSNNGAEYGKIENTVFYGGSGGNDSRIPPEAKERIYRVMSDGYGNLLQKDAVELLEYFKLQPEQRNDGTRPDILRPPKTFEILPSLSILCQGYLVVCAESERKDKYLDDIKLALEEIGWVDETGKRVVAKGNSLIKEDLKAEWGKVQLPNWWYEEVFAWDDLRNKIACECGIDCFSKVDKHIRKLLNDIATTGKRIDPLTVAKAYSAIAKVFAEST
jgi:hypothetical protein